MCLDILESLIHSWNSRRTSAKQRALDSKITRIMIYATLVLLGWPMQLLAWALVSVWILTLLGVIEPREGMREHPLPADGRPRTSEHSDTGALSRPAPHGILCRLAEPRRISDPASPCPEAGREVKAG